MAYILKHAVFRLPIICVVLFTLFLPLLSGSNFSCVVQHSETYCCFVCVSVCRTQQTYCCFVSLCQCVQNTANLLLFFQSVSVCAEHNETYCCFVCVSVCRIVLFPSLSFACLPKTSVVRMYVYERNAILMLQQICMFVGISALILLSVRGYMRL